MSSWLALIFGGSDHWEESEQPVLRSGGGDTITENEDSLDYILLPVAGVAVGVAVYYWYKARKLRATVSTLSKLRLLSKL